VARQRILQAALELMEQLGFARITAEAIAERAGASKATLYRWWPNKAAVVIEAFREAVEPELPFPDTGSFRDDIQTQMRNFARVLAGRGGKMLRAFVVAAHSDPDVAAAFRSIWSVPRRAAAKQMLKRSQQRRQLRREADLDLVLDALYGPLYYRFLVKNENPTAKYAESLADLVLNGLVPVDGEEIGE
jgi:AcrR family transcriptional regulator